MPIIVSDYWKTVLGDCLEVMPTLSPVDAIVTDPPYGLKFMGKNWDHGVPGIPFWKAALGVLKPGGYALIFGGTRTYHRLACAVEDAGFEIRDCIMWVYGSGFPKGKGCLKPAYEPILLCRKPGKVLPLGIDECRIPTDENLNGGAYAKEGGDRDTYEDWRFKRKGDAGEYVQPLGRWPANLAHDGSDEVMEAFAVAGERKVPGPYKQTTEKVAGYSGGWGSVNGMTTPHYGDTGTAARFFYCAKASRSERGEGNTHPTVKPLALMRWLVRLVCPPKGRVLDPFMGSGSTGVACVEEGRRFLGIEREEPYLAIARERIKHAAKGKL